LPEFIEHEATEDSLTIHVDISQFPEHSFMYFITVVPIPAAAVGNTANKKVETTAKAGANISSFFDKSKLPLSEGNKEFLMTNFVMTPLRSLCHMFNLSIEQMMDELSQYTYNLRLRKSKEQGG